MTIKICNVLLGLLPVDSVEKIIAGGYYVGYITFQSMFVYILQSGSIIQFSVNVT